jgi:hypothetical protein
VHDNSLKDGLLENSNTEQEVMNTVIISSVLNSRVKKRIFFRTNKRIEMSIRSPWRKR